MDKFKTKILLISLMLILLLSLQGAAAASDDVNLTSENIDLSICDSEGDADSDSLLAADNGEELPGEGKENSTITITDCPSPINRGEDTYVAFKIDRDVMDNAVDLWINGSYILTYDFEFNEESFLITQDKFPSAGIYNISVQYRGNSMYNPSNIASCLVSVNKNNVTLDPVATGDFVVGGHVYVTFSLPTYIDGNLVVAIDDEPVVGYSIVNGTVTIPGSYDLGNHTVTVNLTGDTYSNDAFGSTTFYIDKASSTITITDCPSPINRGEDSYLAFRINRDVMDNAVTYWIDGVEILTYDFDINEDSFLITKDKFPLEGTYNITIQYRGNSRYNASNIDSCLVSVYKNNVTLDPVATGDFVVGGHVDVSFSLPTYIDGNLVVAIDDEPVVGYVIDNGTVTIPGSYDLGNHTVTVNLTGDTYSNDAFGSTTFYIDKASSTITITDCPSPINIGDDSYVAFIINRDVMDNAVDLWINGSYILTYDFDINEDSFLITKDKFPSAGIYNISVQYRGNSWYNASNIASCLVSVNKIDVAMNARGSTIRYGENATITVTGLPDDAAGIVSVRIGDEIFSANVTNGKAVIEIPGLAVHEYEGLVVEYSGDNKYNGASAQATVIVKPSSSKVVVDPSDDEVARSAENQTQKHASSKAVDTAAAGNPIAILAIALLSLVITYRKRR